MNGVMIYVEEIIEVWEKQKRRNIFGASFQKGISQPDKWSKAYPKKKEVSFARTDDDFSIFQK